MEKYDCFAYENEHKCNALNEKICAGCRFYKTKEQYDKEMENSMRICKEKGIDTYNAYFRFYRRKKKTGEIGGANDESNNNIQES